MSEVDTSAEATLQRYWNPQGGGVEPHDAGLLYLRDDVDAVIAALAAERDALRAENDRLRADLKMARLEVQHAVDHANAAIEEVDRLRAALEIATSRADQWDDDEDLSDWAKPARIIAADIDAALNGGANG